MKKIGMALAVVFCALILFTMFTSYTYAANNQVGAQTQQLVENQKKEKQTLQEYQDAYGDESYGFTAYILHKVQVYSIPFCFIGIAISGIYQYVLGIRKLDTRDKGFAIMASIVTIFIIAQILPLIFAIVVKGWGD